MEVEQINHSVQDRLPEGRYEHVLRVVETAIELARKYNVNEQQAKLAALLHDVAKAMPKEQLQQWIKQSSIDRQYLDFHHELWHAPVGAEIAIKHFGILDEGVLNAIRYHTTGRAQMTPLEMVVYVADMIEPGRTFPGVELLRTAAYESLEEGMRACISHSVQYLVEQRLPVYPLSFECYNASLKLNR